MNLATLIACATCRYALTEERRDNTVIYRHPVSDRDHKVVPVNAGVVRHLVNLCHTCADAPPIWNYRTGLIQIVDLTYGIGETYNEQWHVCYQCAQFIEADDNDGLTARCAALMRWHPASDEYTILHTLQRSIVLSREGRTLLTSAPWPPARITAEMLPKIRDRLTGLLLGPADLPDPINDPDQRQSRARQLDTIAMYWINQEFTDLVNTVSDDQPSGWATDEIAPSQAGLLAWPRPVGPAGQLAAVSWIPEADGWHVTGYRSIGRGVDESLMPALRREIGWLVPIHAQHIPRGTPIDGRHTLGPLITTWLLISQQMAEAIPAKLPKATAKAYRRNQRPAPQVRIVRIKPRAVLTSPERSELGSSRTRTKPDHRFWVSGHPRQQAYGPGRSLRRQIEIQPFLKGDPSLPIKLSTTVRILGPRAAGEEAE